MLARVHDSLAEQADCLLQVGLKMQFQGSQGQLMFFFGNKGEATLERLICVVPPSGQFAFQQGPVPSQLEAKKQVQVAIPALQKNLSLHGVITTSAVWLYAESGLSWLHQH